MAAGPCAEELVFLDFEPKYKEVFASLNLAWIEQYFKVEEPDVQALMYCEENIIKPGGFIWFAQLNGEIVGTVGLMNEGNGVYELVKMAVSPKAQGRQIGTKLCLTVIAKAQEIGAKTLYLESNTCLGPAIAIYKKIGFVEVPMGVSPYTRANIKMVYPLTPEGNQQQ